MIQREACTWIMYNYFRSPCYCNICECCCFITSLDGHLSIHHRFCYVFTSHILVCVRDLVIRVWFFVLGDQYSTITVHKYHLNANKFEHKFGLYVSSYYTVKPQFFLSCVNCYCFYVQKLVTNNYKIAMNSFW